MEPNVEQYPLALVERFWSKVLKAEGGCWEWQASKNPGGYGHIGIGNRQVRTAHRISYELVNGPIVGDLVVCHTCDNPSCVNPAHLFLGTRKDNTQDMIKKGRAKLGGEPGAKKRRPWKTHCKRGHELSGDNLRKGSATRQCHACRMEREKEIRLKKRNSTI